MQTDYVYLIHFSQPISPKHSCQHYLGSAADVEERLMHHQTGKGARLTQVANERGIEYQVVRVWQAEPGQGRQLERKLKNRKSGPDLCPICRNERKRQRNQLAFVWAHPEYEALNFTLDELSELSF
jgi:predicted GIY-YIG superfamily endonuclease